jgi:hypothetical protein
MSAMTLDLPRRFPWPTLLSVAIHFLLKNDAPILNANSNHIQ